MKPYIQILKYIFFDTLASVIVWNLFMYICRFDIIFVNQSWHTLGVAAILLFIHWLSGYYNKAYYKSRLSEFSQTTFSVLCGALLIYLSLEWSGSLVCSDSHIFLYLFLLLFVVTYVFRLSITSVVGAKIKRGELNVNAVVVGVGRKASKLISDISKLPKSTGFSIVGCVASSDDEKIFVDEDNIIGQVGSLKKTCADYNVREIIIAIDNLSDEQLNGIFNEIRDNHIRIQIVPTSRDVLAGVTMSTIYGVPLIDLTSCKMSEGAKNIKRLCDILISIIALIVMSPLMLYFALRIGRPVIYKQERIGFRGKPFYIYKFRSMLVDSEKDGPQLSGDNDERVTNIGRIMRKYRIDELPQFVNVIKGEMSIIGPRPERQYYIDLIEKKVPYYFIINNVRPGITSWGMVKYGYASSVEQMVERAPYDFLYLDNMSILIDCKIAIYTIRTILLGKGL